MVSRILPEAATRPSVDHFPRANSNFKTIISLPPNQWFSVNWRSHLNYNCVLTAISLSVAQKRRQYFLLVDKKHLSWLMVPQKIGGGFVKEINVIKLLWWHFSTVDLMDFHFIIITIIILYSFLSMIRLSFFYLL